jgi:hypothetical protein
MQPRAVSLNPGYSTPASSGPRKQKARPLGRAFLTSGMALDQFFIAMQAMSLRLNSLQAASAEFWSKPAKRAR